MTKTRSRVIRDMSAPRDSGPYMAPLGDGKRLHLQHGPIDLIIEADGSRDDVTAAYRQAAAAFRTVLTDLVDELALLRNPVCSEAAPTGAVARAMWRATLCHRANGFVTPMAAVAGAVSDHVLGAMLDGRQLTRAYVNNGGDIALHLSPGQTFDIAVCGNPVDGERAARVQIGSADRIGGVATSGWRGRSHSLGVADAVTVLAPTAAAADAAATLIANAVDVPGSPQVHRTPAVELSPDSDLGTRLVTVDVGDLGCGASDVALASGCALAEQMRDRGLIAAAFLSLQGESRTLEPASLNLSTHVLVREMAHA